MHCFARHGAETVCLIMCVFVYLIMCVFVYLYLCIYICVFVFVYLSLCICICVLSVQNGGDLRLLSRLSDLNGQIPSPLSQTFLTHDDDGHHGDGHHDVGHHDDDNEAKIIQL